jgi:hypothetical protein
MNELEKRLEEACKWHQRNDKNGDFDVLWNDYKRGEIGIDTVRTVCINAFIEIRDEHLSADDVEAQDEVSKWISYLENAETTKTYAIHYGNYRPDLATWEIAARTQQEAVEAFRKVFGYNGLKIQQVEEVTK